MRRNRCMSSLRSTARKATLKPEIIRMNALSPDARPPEPADQPRRHDRRAAKEEGLSGKAAAQRPETLRIEPAGRAVPTRRRLRQDVDRLEDGEAAGLDRFQFIPENNARRR